MAGAPVCDRLKPDEPMHSADLLLLSSPTFSTFKAGCKPANVALPAANSRWATQSASVPAPPAPMIRILELELITQVTRHSSAHDGSMHYGTTDTLKS